MQICTELEVNQADKKAVEIVGAKKAAKVARKVEKQEKKKNRGKRAEKRKSAYSTEELLSMVDPYLEDLYGDDHPSDERDTVKSHLKSDLKGAIAFNGKLKSYLVHFYYDLTLKGLKEHQSCRCFICGRCTPDKDALFKHNAKHDDPTDLEGKTSKVP